MQRFHFDSALKRMATIVKVEAAGSNAASYWVLMKGAAEVVKTFLDDASTEYDSVSKRYAAQGSRYAFVCSYYVAGCLQRAPPLFEWLGHSNIFNLIQVVLLQGDCVSIQTVGRHDVGHRAAQHAKAGG